MAAGRGGVAPGCVPFDAWYSGVENLKACRSLGWPWLTRFRSDRRVNPDRAGLRAVSECEIAATGTVVHLERYGLVPFDSARGEVFRIVAGDGTTEHWASSDPAMDDLGRLRLADAGWPIAEYHRGLSSRSPTSSGASAASAGRAQRGHIGLARRAFVVFERWCWRTGVSGYAAKRQIVHHAIRAYRTNPLYRLGTA